jgi:hypothetical protein
MADPKMKLPPGATLVDDGNGGSMALPPGAKLVSGPTQGTQIKAAPGMFTLPWIKEKFYNAADKVTNAMPAAGGIAGGLIGSGAGSLLPGPGTAAGGVAGAVIGGGGGEAARQLTRRALGFESPQTSSDAAEEIGGEGLRQGLYEVGGRALGAMGKAIAPKMAEAAVAPGKRLLKSIPEDVNIGKTILGETTGTSMGSISNQLKSKIANASDAVDTLAQYATNAGKKVSLQQPRQIVAGEMGAASAKNSPSYLRDVNKVSDQLTYQFGQDGRPLQLQMPNGQSAVAKLPADVSPTRARSLKQGIGIEIGNWNPEAQSAIAPLQERLYGTLNSGFHAAVPEAAPLDKAMTSMIPAQQAAWNTSFNPGLTKSLFERFARPTGALVGAAAGAKFGNDEGGIPGAIGGGLMGLAAPNMIASPRGLMIGARGANSQLTPQIIKAAIDLIDSQRKRQLDANGKNSQSQ